MAAPVRTALRPAPSAYPAHRPAPYRGNPSPRPRTPAHRHRPRGRHKSPVLRPGCRPVQRQPLLRVAAQPGPPGIRCTILKLRRAPGTPPAPPRPGPFSGCSLPCPRRNPPAHPARQAARSGCLRARCPLRTIPPAPRTPPPHRRGRAPGQQSGPRQENR